MQGLTTQASAGDAATWSELVILCGSYEEAGEFLAAKGVKRALRGKCVLNLANGTPQEAEATAACAKRAGARYLDACLLVRPPCRCSTPLRPWLDHLSTLSTPPSRRAS